jgi:GntR family transcriptional regulator / MocR family aminotransferase
MNRRTTPYQLVLPPRTSRVPTSHWLREALRSGIMSGMLGPGQRMPATREIARHYGLSRGTVLTAIEDLKAEGYVRGVPGSGTFVCDLLPEGLRHGGELAVDHKQAPTAGFPRLSDYAMRVKPVPYFVNPASLAFRTNLPALDLFPTSLWAQVASRRLRRVSISDLLGSNTRGYGPLRQVLAQYLRAERGVRCETEQIVIVSGIQEALDLVARLLLNPGDRVLMEDPGFQGAYVALEAAGANVVAMPIDSEGAAPLRSDFRDARLMYVTPGHQFPTGITMTHSRRAEILQQAREWGTIILEDDYDSEYRYAGHPIPAMQGLDKDNSVIFTGGFNKVLFPSLRMAYIVFPPALIETVVMTKALVTRHHSVLDQAVLCDFIEQGHFGRHLRRMRKVYAERWAALSHYASRHLSGVLRLSDIEAGLQTTGWLKAGILAEDVALAAAKRRIDVVPLSRYCHASRLEEGLQIGFAAVDEAAIEKGILALAEALGSVDRA